MDDAIDDPHHWLERAKDARAVAKQLKDETMRNIMEDIAKSYEKIADHAAHSLKDLGHSSR